MSLKPGLRSHSNKQIKMQPVQYPSKPERTSNCSESLMMIGRQAGRQNRGESKEEVRRKELARASDKGKNRFPFRPFWMILSCSKTLLFFCNYNFLLMHAIYSTVLPFQCSGGGGDSRVFSTIKAGRGCKDHLSLTQAVP